MTIEVDGRPAVHIKGVVTATGPDTLKASIANLLGNLKEYFQGARSINLKDIDVEMDKSNTIKQVFQTYFVKFGYNLP